MMNCGCYFCEPNEPGCEQFAGGDLVLDAVTQDLRFEQVGTDEHGNPGFFCIDTMTINYCPFCGRDLHDEVFCVTDERTGEVFAYLPDGRELSVCGEQ